MNEYDEGMEGTDLLKDLRRQLKEQSAKNKELEHQMQDYKRRIGLLEYDSKFKLDSLEDITQDGELNKLVSMVSELSMISTALDSDFNALEISSENSIRKQLTSGLNKLDNGAKDNNPTANQACLGVVLFDVIASSSNNLF